MERYLGCDPHATSCTFSVLNQSGRQIRRDVVETHGRALVGYIQQVPGNLHLCVEEGEWSQWLHEILSPHVVELVVFRKPWRPGAKNDAIDARELAERLRTGRIGSPIYKVSRHWMGLRESARAYMMVTRDVARVKTRIKSFYRSRGVNCAGREVYQAGSREQWLRRLRPATRYSVELMNRELDVLEGLKVEAERRMLQESRRHGIARILETGPGMGPVRVAQLMPVVGTPYRFRTKRQFWSYCGFGVVTHTSSDWVRENGVWDRRPVRQTRGLSFSHNRRLKAIFKGAATTVIAHAGRNPLREAYDRMLEQGTKPNLAKLTVARKIAAIVLAMWKAKEKYDPARVKLTQGS